MENKSQNVFDRLDSIEAMQSTTQVQNQQIIDLLNNLNNQQNTAININFQSQLTEQQLLKKFFKSSKKEYLLVGSNKEFNKSKLMVNILFLSLVVIGVLSTIFTSMAIKLYSTFSFFENIWLVLACFLFSYSINAKKKMTDIELKNHSNTIFVLDGDGTWRNTKKEKKRFRWFRRISYIAIFLNIICIWKDSSGIMAIIATLLELAFFCITIAILFTYDDLFCMYGDVILFTGRNISNTKNITLIFDVVNKKLAPYEEYKEKMKENL